MNRTDRIKKIIEDEFNRAAHRAESRIAPLLKAEFKKLTKLIPELVYVDDAMGVTIVHFDGRMTDASWFRLSSDCDSGDPAFATEEQQRALEEFLTLYSSVVDHRSAYALYSKLERES